MYFIVLSFTRWPFLCDKHKHSRLSNLMKACANGGGEKGGIGNTTALLDNALNMAPKFCHTLQIQSISEPG